MSQFFHIKEEDIEGYSIFPFHIYLFSSKINKYTFYLSANSPMDKKIKEDLKEKTKSFFSIAVLKTQEKTFFNYIEMKERSVALKQEVTKKKKNKSSEDFLSRKSLQQAFSDGNFLSSTSDLNLGESQIDLPIFIREDKNIASYTSQVIFLSYHLAILCHLNGPEELQDIISAVALAQIGRTQFNLSHSRTSSLDSGEYLSETIRILSESSYPLTNRSLSIISDHTNQWYFKKKKKNAHPMSLIVAASFHILKINDGKVFLNKKGLDEVLMDLQNFNIPKNIKSTLIPEKLYNSLITIFQEKESPLAA